MGEHKTKIGGTNYNIIGGKTKIGGTNYTINQGKTLIGGTTKNIIVGKPQWKKLYTDANTMTGTSYFGTYPFNLTVPANLNAIYILGKRSGQTLLRYAAGWFKDGNTGRCCWSDVNGAYVQLDSYSGTTLSYTLRAQTQGDTRSTDVWGLQGKVTWVSGSTTTNKNTVVGVSPTKPALFACVYETDSFPSATIWNVDGNNEARQYRVIDACAWIDGVFTPLSGNDMGIIFIQSGHASDGSRIDFRTGNYAKNINYAYCY